MVARESPHAVERELGLSEARSVSISTVMSLRKQLDSSPPLVTDEPQNARLIGGQEVFAECYGLSTESDCRKTEHGSAAK